MKSPQMITNETHLGKISVERRKALSHLAVSGSLTGSTASGQVGSTNWVRVRATLTFDIQTIPATILRQRALRKAN